ncbi:MAG: hypothetical protein JSU90_04315 [Nitrospiraceae bacterium]|nr:MAG: hypothetical protein JSU90_04315 [Nitrospiraceae bacterium]
MNRINQEENSSKGTNNETQEDTIKRTITTWRKKKGALLAALSAGLTVIALGLALNMPAAAARGWFRGPQSAEQILERLTERLALSEHQIEAIRPLIEEKVQMRNELWKEETPDRRAMRRETLKLRWETERRLGEILTDEQIGKYLDFRQEQRGGKKWGSHRFGRMAGTMGKTPEQAIARLSSRLDLTDDQAAAAEPIIRESLDKKRAVFEKYQGQGPSTRLAMRDEMLAIGDETHEQLSAILTAEQIDEHNAMQEERRARRDRRMDCPRADGFLTQ